MIKRCNVRVCYGGLDNDEDNAGCEQECSDEEIPEEMVGKLHGCGRIVGNPELFFNNGNPFMIIQYSGFPRHNGFARYRHAVGGTSSHPKAPPFKNRGDPRSPNTRIKNPVYPGRGV